MRVDQVIPSLASRDAIGAHTLAICQALRESGIESDIFYGTCTPDLLGRAHPMSRLGRASKDRWLLYQASIGSPVFDVFAGRPEPKMVNYHNITPPKLLDWWEPAVGHELTLGRAQLVRVADVCRLAVADSAFNEAELAAAGFSPTAVVPLMIDMASVADPDPAVARRLAEAKDDGGPDFLFVGKVSPHKAQHDLVKMLAVYRRVYDGRARLHLVGSPLGRTYGPALEAFVEELGLCDAVHISGSVTPEELEAYYRGADVYVSASDHEGFGVPLVEAMSHGLPVVAYESTAVPETVGSAGLLLSSKTPLKFAAAVHRIVEDKPVRRHFIDAGLRRAEHFVPARTRSRFVRAVTEVLAAAPS